MTAQANIARTNLQRNRELVAQNFVSQSVVDQAQANLEVAEAQDVTVVCYNCGQTFTIEPDPATVLQAGDNLFIYFEDGLGNFIEYQAELLQIQDDEHHRPKVWKAGPNAMNQWGPAAPAGFQ